MNILSNVMKTVTSDQGVNGTTKELETRWVKYPSFLTTQPSLLLPDSVISIMNGTQRTLLTYDKYNLKEKLLQYTGSDKVTVTCLWGYGNKYPVAEIRNATYQNVLNALGGTAVVDRIANSLILSDGDKQIINNLRNTMPYALITSFTYQPGSGILTSTDPAGRITYYEYDPFGRLVRIKDHSGKIIEDFIYNYK
jgi:YD repeat-containing protein